MFLFNPLYIISHVIYADSKTEFIFIDSNCWNRLFNGVFSNHKPTKEEIAQLKRLCYDLYMAFLETKEVKTDRFNSGLAKLQGLSVSVEETETLITEYNGETVIKLSTDSEGFFLDRPNLPNDSDLSEKWLEEEADKVSRFKEFVVEASTILNLSITESKRTNQLVTLIGFGRILSIFRILCLSQEVSLYTPTEIEYFRRNPELICLALKYQNKSYSYLCPECKKIGKHDHIYIENRSDLDTHFQKRDVHIDSISFFDQNGWINVNQYTKYNMTKSLSGLWIEFKSEKSKFKFNKEIPKTISLALFFSNYLIVEEEKFVKIEEDKRKSKFAAHRQEREVNAHKFSTTTPPVENTIFDSSTTKPAVVTGFSFGSSSKSTFSFGKPKTDSAKKK